MCAGVYVGVYRGFREAFTGLLGCLKWFLCFNVLMVFFYLLQLLSGF